MGARRGSRLLRLARQGVKIRLRHGQPVRSGLLLALLLGQRGLRAVQLGLGRAQRGLCRLQVQVGLPQLRGDALQRGCQLSRALGGLPLLLDGVRTLVRSRRSARGHHRRQRKSEGAQCSGRAQAKAPGTPSPH